MTGLDITKDHLIEIAVLITDGDLNVVAEVSLWENTRMIDGNLYGMPKGPELIIHQPKQVMDSMNGMYDMCQKIIHPIKHVYCDRLVQRASRKCKWMMRIEYNVDTSLHFSC